MEVAFGGHVGRSLRQLVSVYPQSGDREMDVAVTSLSCYSVQDPSPRMLLSVVKVSLLTLIKPHLDGSLALG